jgi:SWI/SNF-related matrix-associated actin-dependent regulator 1 of chromatin subfamily A
MPASLTKNGDQLEVDLSKCRGSDFQDALLKVKAIAGRRFDGETKLWLLPADPTTAEQAMHALQPEMSKELLEWIRQGRMAQATELTTPIPDDAELVVDWAGDEGFVPHEDNPETGLYPHQRALVDLAVGQKKLILGDDMGLGKTVQMIATVREYELRNASDPAPKLIVCPNSVKGVWAREIRKWLGDDEPHQIIDATTFPARLKQLDAIIAENGWVIVNWEFLRTQKETVALKNGGKKKIEALKVKQLGTTPWRAVLADEVHRAKNRKAAQTRGLHRVQGDLMIGASGTPLMNSPDELWSILKWLYPKEYTSYWRFFEQYVQYTEGYFGKIITGVKNPDALRFELKHRLVRRTKDLLDLPDKTRVYVPVQLSPKQRKIYRSAETELWLEIEKAAKGGDDNAAQIARAATEGGAKAMYRIMNGASRTVRLRQILETPATLEGEDISAKLDACQEIILDNSTTQHVVFTEFVATTGILAERLKAKGLTVETYTGKTEEHVRTDLQDQFQAGEIDVLIGTMGAMREGITLTAASTEHFISRHWTPAINEQCEDRCHRVGQKNPLTIYIYLADNSVDVDKVEPTNRLKEFIVKSVIKKDNIKEVTK